MSNQNVTKFERDLNPKVVEYLSKTIPEFDIKTLENTDEYMFDYYSGEVRMGNIDHPVIISDLYIPPLDFTAFINVTNEEPYASYTFIDGDSHDMIDTAKGPYPDILSAFEHVYHDYIIKNSDFRVVRYGNKDYVYIGRYYDIGLLVNPDTKETATANMWFLPKYTVNRTTVEPEYLENIPFDILGGLTFKQFLLARTLIEFYKVVEIVRRIYYPILGINEK